MSLPGGPSLSVLIHVYLAERRLRRRVIVRKCRRLHGNPYQVVLSVYRGSARYMIIKRRIADAGCET